MDRHPMPLPHAHRRSIPRILTVSLLLVLTLPGSASRANAADTAKANEPRTPEAAEFVVVESKGSYETQGKIVTIERFEPKGEGKYPAVLVIHGAGGMTIGGPWFRE